MLWITALLSVIIWALGRESGFLGPNIHVFLLVALLASLAALLRSQLRPAPVPAAARPRDPDAAPAPGIPGADTERA